MILVTWYSALPVQLGVLSTSGELRKEKHNNKIKASSGNILYRRQVRNRGKFPTKCIEILSSFSKWLDWSLWLLLIFKVLIWLVISCWWNFKTLYSLFFHRITFWFLLLLSSSNMHFDYLSLSSLLKIAKSPQF